MDSQKALEWIAEVLAVNGRPLTLDDTRLTVSEWDSLGTLLLMSRLQEDHGIVVSAEQLAAMNSMRELCALLEHRPES